MIAKAAPAPNYGRRKSMSGRSEESEAFIRLLQDKPVAYHPTLAHKLGSVTTALYLSQLLWWDNKGRDKDWFYKTVAETAQETGLTRREQDTARKQLLALGVIECERRSIPAKLHFHVCFDALLEWLKTPNKSGGKRQTVVAENATLLHESTQENTSESTLRETGVPEVSRAVKDADAIDATVDETIPLDSPKTDKPKRGGTAHRRMVAVLLDVCHVDNTLGSYAAKVAKQLLDGDYAPGQIEKWYGPDGWWYKVHTKGWSEEFRKPPSLSKVAQTALLAKEHLNDGRVGVANDDGTFYI